MWHLILYLEKGRHSQRAMPLRNIHASYNTRTFTLPIAVLTQSLCDTTLASQSYWRLTLALRQLKFKSTHFLCKERRPVHVLKWMLVHISSDNVKMDMSVLSWSNQTSFRTWRRRRQRCYFYCPKNHRLSQTGHRVRRWWVKPCIQRRRFFGQ